MKIVIKLSVLILSLFFFCLPIAIAQSGWVAKQSNTQNTLLGIDFLPSDPQELIAVGSNFVIRRSTDSGLTWHEGFDPYYLFDVAFTDTGTTAVLITVGAQGTILRSQNGGTSWSTRTSPTTSRLHDVDFPTPSIGYAVGELGVNIKTTDGGLTWMSGGVISPFDMYGVSFADANTGTVVGVNGSIWQTYTGGAAWIARNSGTPLKLNSVDYYPSDPDEIVAVGDSGIIIRTTDGGLTWVGGGSPDPTELNRIVFYDDNYAAIAGDIGKVYLTSDGGNNWIHHTTGISTPLFGIAYYPSDPNNITTVGGDGVILQTTDGGATWIQQTSYTLNVLRGIAVTRTNRLSVGAGNNKRRSTNNGASWSIISTGYPLRDVCMIAGTQEAWVVGDQSSTSNSVFFHSTDGGVNWEKNFLFSAESFSSVQFINSQQGYVGSSTLGRVYRTTDGGTNWTNTSTPPPMVRVFDLAFAGADSGHCVGASGLDGRISFTTNSGTNWTGQAPVGIPFLRGIDFYPSDPAERTAVGDSGTVFGTTDFGVTWTERVSGTIQDLEQIAYGSASNLYAVGNAGTIIRSSDGGTTWNLQSSGTTTTLSDVVFISSDTGFVVGNNGLILATTNGGATFVEEEKMDEMPTEFLLLQNYPNPFNPSTSIQYAVSNRQFVSLKIYDVLGNEIETLINEEKLAGTYEVTWYAENLPSGVYFYQLKAEEYISTRKMILIK